MVDAAVMENNMDNMDVKILYVIFHIICGSIAGPIWLHLYNKVYEKDGDEGGYAAGVGFLLGPVGLISGITAIILNLKRK